MAEKSLKSRCAISRSFGCDFPDTWRPIERTPSTCGLARHSCRTPWPTIPVAPNRITFICRLRTPGNPRGDLARHKLKSAARRFVVEQDSAGGVHSVSFAVVARQIETGHLTDAVGGSGVKPGIFVLRDSFRQSKHFARPREVEAAV